MAVPAWMGDPARGCADTPWDDLFGPRVVQEKLARQLCQPCPVLQPCRDRGRREPYGLYGGVPEGGEGRPRTSDQRGRDRFNSRAVPA